MNELSRRSFIKADLAAGVAGCRTPAICRNSFPRRRRSRDRSARSHRRRTKDFDLARIEGSTGVAKGQVIIVEGRVVDTTEAPVEDASVDLWQANADSRYQTSPRSERGRRWILIFRAGLSYLAARTAAFDSRRSIRVHTLPGNTGRGRPHIHFKVTKRGYVELTTQMYFPRPQVKQ